MELLDDVKVHMINSVPTLHTQRASTMTDSRYESISLQELDPSPVDESPVDVEKGEYFPRQNDPTSPPARTSSLGLSGHSAIWWRMKCLDPIKRTAKLMLDSQLPECSATPPTLLPPSSQPT